MALWTVPGAATPPKGWPRWLTISIVSWQRRHLDTIPTRLSACWETSRSACPRTCASELTRQVTTANPGTDAVKVLKQKSRLSGRDAKRMAKVAERLPDLPNVAEALADGEITVDHAKAMADAADKVGPDVVDSDPWLLEEATKSGPDWFARKVRDWSNQKLIEAGIDILERQRRAREAKLWTDPKTGMGMIFAKLTPAQFAHLQQAADAHYLELLRRDRADGQDPDRVRTPAQRMADALVRLFTNLDTYSGVIPDRQHGSKGQSIHPGGHRRRTGRSRRDQPPRTVRDHRGRPRTARYPPYLVPQTQSWPQ